MEQLEKIQSTMKARRKESTQGKTIEIYIKRDIYLKKWVKSNLNLSKSFRELRKMFLIF